MTAADETIDKRLATLEQAVAELQEQVADAPRSADWIEKVTGSISDEDAFMKALEHGRAFRNADRPLDDAGDQP